MTGQFYTPEEVEQLQAQGKFVPRSMRVIDARTRYATPQSGLSSGGNPIADAQRWAGTFHNFNTGQVTSPWANKMLGNTPASATPAPAAPPAMTGAWSNVNFGNPDAAPDALTKSLLSPATPKDNPFTFTLGGASPTIGDMPASNASKSTPTWAQRTSAPALGSVNRYQKFGANWSDTPAKGGITRSFTSKYGFGSSYIPNA